MPTVQALHYPEMDPPQETLRKFALFFDTVASLVPSEERENLSPETREFAEHIPDAYEPVEPPEDPNVVFDPNVRSVLDSAFALIEDEREGRLPGLMILQVHGRKVLLPDTITVPGGLRFRDTVLLHDSKIPPDIRESLKQHRLVLPKHFAKGDLRIDPHQFEGYTLVEERASDLILSHVADYVARQYGWDTVTTSQLDFAACSASHMRRRERGEAETASLASALISVLIPAGIEDLDIRTYVDLRNSYEGVRGPFDRLVRELDAAGRLSKTADSDTFEGKIKDLTSEFEEEIEKAHTTKLARAIKSWVPFAATQLLSFAAGFLTGDPGLSHTLAGGAGAVAFFDKGISVASPKSEYTDTYQQLASLRGDASKYLKKLL